MAVCVTLKSALYSKACHNRIKLCMLKNIFIFGYKSLFFVPFAIMLLVSNEKSRANFHLCSAINIDSVIVSGSLKS